MTPLLTRCIVDNKPVYLMLADVTNVTQERCYDSQWLPWVRGIPWHRADHELPVVLGVLDDHPHPELPVPKRDKQFSPLVIKWVSYELPKYVKMRQIIAPPIRGELPDKEAKK